MPRRLLALAGLLLSALAVACANKAVAPEDQFTPQPGIQNAYIVTDDGTVLNGRLFGSEHANVVILTHMRPNDQTAWYPFAEQLAEEGYAALTFNFRGYGESGGDKDSSRLDDDLEAAIRYMRDSGKARVYLIGASMGATAALVVGSRAAVQAVVAISPPARFEEQDAIAAMGANTTPTLLIASDDDKAPLEFDELVAAASQPYEVQTYTGNAHGTDLFQSDHAAALEERILGFLQEEGGP